MKGKKRKKIYCWWWRERSCEGREKTTHP